MIAMESGTAFAYAIDKLQDRGKFFIYPQDEVYAGQVVGEHVHENDLVINVTKSKKLTNMRASGSDDKARIIPPVIFSLEEALEYIKEDEYVEVTPKSMRMRKIILDENERKRANRKIDQSGQLDEIKAKGAGCSITARTFLYIGLSRIGPEEGN